MAANFEKSGPPPEEEQPPAYQSMDTSTPSHQYSSQPQTQTSPQHNFTQPPPRVGEVSYITPSAPPSDPYPKTDSEYQSPPAPPQQQYYQNQPQQANPNTPLLIPNTAPLKIASKLPVQIPCPNCRVMVLTRTEKQAGLAMWAAVGGTFFICFPCAWVPCLIDDLKDTKHFCPHCNLFLGENKIIE